MLKRSPYSSRKKSTKLTCFSRRGLGFVDRSIAVSRGAVGLPRLSFSLERFSSSIPREKRRMRFQGRTREPNSGLCPLQDDKHLLHPQTLLRKNHIEEYLASSRCECPTFQMASTIADPCLGRNEVPRRTYLASSTRAAYLTSVSQAEQVSIVFICRHNLFLDFFEKANSGCGYPILLTNASADTTGSVTTARQA